MSEIIEGLKEVSHETFLDYLDFAHKKYRHKIKRIKNSNVWFEWHFKNDIKRYGKPREFIRHQSHPFFAKMPLFAIENPNEFTKSHRYYIGGDFKEILDEVIEKQNRKVISDLYCKDILEDVASLIYKKAIGEL